MKSNVRHVRFCRAELFACNDVVTTPSGRVALVLSAIQRTSGAGACQRYELRYLDESREEVTLPGHMLKRVPEVKHA